MYKLWQSIRPYICEKRIYRYGLIGAWVNDDRTTIERVCDKIDNWFLTRVITNRQRGKTVFRPWFDWSMGRWISDKSDIKAIEKETGYEMVSVADWERESKRQRAIIDKSHEEHLENKLKGVIRDVQQGRKFTHESMEKRRRICRENGITRLPGGHAI